MKIIYITSHKPAYESGAYMPEPEIKINFKNNIWSGFWRGDWGDKLGSLLKGNFPDIEYECWQPDCRVDKIYEHRFNDGILHKKFPAVNKTYIFGAKIIRTYYSHCLIDELNRINNNSPIIHIGADYNLIGSRIHKLFNERIPIISWFLLNIDLNIQTCKNANFFQKFHRYLISKDIKSHIRNIKYPVVFNDYSKEVISRLTDRKVYVMPWAIVDYNFWKCDMDKIELRREFNIPAEEKVFFSSSRIVESKQIDKLIKVFAHFNNYKYKLFISGTGPKDYLNYIKELISGSKLNDKIILLGYIDEILLKKYYIMSDYFISGSISEGGPTSGLYALALEKKMIVTDTGYVADTLKEFNSGIIIPVTGFDKWKAEIKDVLEGKEIKVIDRELIKTKFDTNQYLLNLMNLYKKALSDFERG